MTTAGRGSIMAASDGGAAPAGKEVRMIVGAGGLGAGSPPPRNASTAYPLCMFRHRPAGSHIRYLPTFLLLIRQRGILITVLRYSLHGIFFLCSTSGRQLSMQPIHSTWRLVPPLFVRRRARRRRRCRRRRSRRAFCFRRACSSCFCCSRRARLSRCALGLAALPTFFCCCVRSR